MKIAAVFPGQGSQSVGMLKDLSERTGIVRETFDQGSQVLGYDLWELVQEGPEETLKQTEYTQPVMFASGIAVWRSWVEAGGPEFTVMAGHSLGEYAALTASGVFSYEEAMSLVAERGRLMAGAVPEGVGGMAAVLGLDDDVIRELCEEINGERVVQAVNFNSPGQVVISGHLDAVEKAAEVAKEKGARRAVLLPVSVPNHSSLMDGVVEPLATRIAAMTTGECRVPVVQNLEAKSYDSVDEMLAALKKHVNSPVNWTASIPQIAATGAELVIEMGPGKVLTGLTRRINKSLTTAFVQDADTLDKALAQATTSS